MQLFRVITSVKYLAFLVHVFFRSLAARNLTMCKKNCNVLINSLVMSSCNEKKKINDAKIQILAYAGLCTLCLGPVIRFLMSSITEKWSKMCDKTIKHHTEAARQRCSRKRCSENIQQTYRRTPTTKCNFNKVAL